MEPLAVALMFFAGLGLLLIALDLAAASNDPTPSEFRGSAAPFGLAVFVICGILAIAAWVS